MLLSTITLSKKVTMKVSDTFWTLRHSEMRLPLSRVELKSSAKLARAPADTTRPGQKSPKIWGVSKVPKSEGRRLRETRRQTKKGMSNSFKRLRPQILAQHAWAPWKVATVTHQTLAILSVLMPAKVVRTPQLPVRFSRWLWTNKLKLSNYVNNSIRVATVQQCALQHWTSRIA